jgi:dolichyl-phosphate beta-glucosyltransferase
MTTSLRADLSAVYMFVIPVKDDLRVYTAVSRIRRFAASANLTADIIVCGTLPQSAVASLGVPFVTVSSGRKGMAVREGVLRATGAVIVICDADVPVGDGDLQRIVAALADCDIVVASRTANGSSRAQGISQTRRILGSCFRALVHRLFKLSGDTQCGVKALRRSAALQLFESQLATGLAYDVELMLKVRHMRLRCREVPVTIQNGTQSVVRPLQAVCEVLRDLAVLWFRLGRAESPTISRSGRQRCRRSAHSVCKRLNTSR